ncbi:hypothetical protein AAVH_39738 [Aphelenchoides avenae]|nr:hypothetical protein AAVH_39738 [Aphelenchus avenae]
MEILGSLQSGMSALDFVEMSTVSPGTCQLPISSTVTAISSIWWPSIALNLARKAVDDVPVTSNVDAKTWEERKAHNNATAANVVCKLHSEFNTTGYSFDALVYLPFTDARMHCLKSDNDSFYEYKRRNTNYFVKRYRSDPVKDQKAASKWKKVGGHTAVLDSMIATAAANLCTRLAEVERNFVDGEAITLIAAVRCGYTFVWYQLAYRYFPAAGTTSKFVMTSNSKNVYSPNCGQIIFFR